MTIQTDPAAPAARWVDHEGCAELAEFRGPEGERMLTFLHLPASKPMGAVLICSPVLGEFAKNYRREVLLARRLAKMGFVVERFHYRNTGNSDGDSRDLTFDTMRDDAVACAAHVRAEAPGVPLFLVGARWGGLIAGAAAGANPEAGLVLWEPLLDASKFLKDAFRSRLVKDVKDGAAAPMTRQQLEERLRAGRSVDVVAHTIDVAFYRSMENRVLESELGSAARPVLLMQVGATTTVRPDIGAQAERWRAAGLEVDVETIRGEETWWLVEERWSDESKRPMTRDLLRTTTTWLAHRVGVEVRR